MAPAHTEVWRLLQGLDPALAVAAFDGAFDKLSSFDESGVMVAEFTDGFPALAAIAEQLALRVHEEIADPAGQSHVVTGCVVGFLTLIEYGHTESMRFRFGDPLGP